MAKCKDLTRSAVKGLSCNLACKCSCIQWWCVDFLYQFFTDFLWIFWDI